MGENVIPYSILLGEKSGGSTSFIKVHNKATKVLLSQIGKLVYDMF